MNMLAGMLAIQKTPVFVAETHSEKSVRGKSRAELAYNARAERQKICTDLIRNNPLSYSATQLGKILNVSPNTVRTDLAEIKKIKKGNKPKVSSKYYYRGK